MENENKGLVGVDAGRGAGKGIDTGVFIDIESVPGSEVVRALPSNPSGTWHFRGPMSFPPKSYFLFVTMTPPGLRRAFSCDYSAGRAIPNLLVTVAVASSAFPKKFSTESRKVNSTPTSSAVTFRSARREPSK